MDFLHSEARIRVFEQNRKQKSPLKLLRIQARFFCFSWINLGRPKTRVLWWMFLVLVGKYEVISQSNRRWVHVESPVASPYWKPWKPCLKIMWLGASQNSMQEDPNKNKINNHIYQKLVLIMGMGQVHVQPSRLELELLHKLRITLAVVYFPSRLVFTRTQEQGTSLVVIWGFHPLSLSMSDKETVPEGNTFGCKITGLNTPEIGVLN